MVTVSYQFNASGIAELQHSKLFGTMIAALKEYLSHAPDQHQSVATRALGFVHGPAAESPPIAPPHFTDIVGQTLGRFISIPIGP